MLPFSTPWKHRKYQGAEKGSILNEWIENLWLLKVKLSILPSVIVEKNDFIRRS